MGEIKRRETLNKYWEKGAYPTGKQAEDTWESFWHKEDDLIPIPRVDGLPDELNNKYNQDEGEVLERRMDEAEATLADHAGRFQGIYERLDEAEERLDDHDETLEGHGNRLNAAEGRLDGHDQDIDGLRAKDQEQDGRLTTAEGSISSQGTRLGIAEGKITALEGKVGIAETDINGLKAKDTEQDGRLDGHDTTLSQHGSRITATEGRLDGHDTELANHEGRLDGHDQDIDALQAKEQEQDGRLTTAEGSISSQGTRLGTAEGKITALEGKASTAETDISGLKAKDTEQDNRLTTAEKAIADLELTDPGQVAFRMTAAEGAIDDLKGRMTTAEGSISSQSTRLGTAEGKVTALEGKASTAETDITGLKAKDTAQDGKISTLEGKVSTAETDIIGLKSTTTNHDTQIKANADEIAAIWEAIDNGATIPSTQKIAGRRWPVGYSDPQSDGTVVGNLAFLQNIKQEIGFGDYLVKDGIGRKLDDNDHYKFADGPAAALDGTMGDYMWGWKTFYWSRYEKDGFDYWMVALDPALLEGHKYYKIPAGYEPATGFATFDHEKQELGCVISDADRYKGGCIQEDAVFNDIQREFEELGVYDPNGKPAVGMDWPTASVFARKKGLGWEAGYYYSDAIFKMLFPITHGTRNAQAPFRAEKDANGLYQGGLGEGSQITEEMMIRLLAKLGELGASVEGGLYYLFFPLIPTSAGIEFGDKCGVATTDLYFPDGTLWGTVEVPVYFGKKHPFGNLFRMVHGILVNYDSTAKKGTAYVRKSLYEQDSYDPSKGYIEAGTVCMTDGYISALLTDKLAFLPTETAATPMTGFCDDHWSGVESNNPCACVSGGLAFPVAGAGSGSGAGAFCSFTVFTPSDAFPVVGVPLNFKPAG